MKRKSILLLLSAALIILTVGVTVAFFRDTENSEGNSFVAGSIDLKLSNTSYYNGELILDAGWQFTDLDDEQGPYNGKYLFYDFNDLKPGDWGEGTLGVKVIDNDSWLCADVTVSESLENSITGPERRLEDDDQTGELVNALNFIWWTDDGDNVLEEGEEVISQSTLADVPVGIPAPVIFADSSQNLWNPEGGPFPGDSDRYVGSGWCYGELVLAPRPQGENSPLGPVENSGFVCKGEDVGDISQSDSAKLDVLFYAVQARHNSDFVCPSLKYPLNVTKSGNGTGSVLSDLPGIDCGDDCSEDFYRTLVVTLTPIPDISSDFVGWSGDCTGTDTCNVTMDKVKNVEAGFAIKTFNLSVGKIGNGLGTITSNPDGINYPGDNSEVYNYGSVVSLNAIAAENSNFVGWGGACVGSGECIVTMDQTRSVTAQFTLKTYSLTVSKNGTGTGTVNSSPGGIYCGSSCSVNYNHGTLVTLSPSPSYDSVFVGWGGACSGVGSCSVTMDEAKTVTATFNKIQYTLMMTMPGARPTGAVTANPAGISCWGDCSQNYDYSTAVTLTANSIPGYVFVGWGGDCWGSSLTCTVLMYSAKNVSATYRQVLSIAPDRDSYVSNTASGTNYGSSTTLQIRDTWSFSAPTEIREGLIRFDLSSIPYVPSASNIASATLKIYVTSVSGSGSMSLYPFISSWQENTVTWSNMPATSGTSSGSSSWIDGSGWVFINVTDAVKAMRLGNNYGWKIDGGGNNHNFYLASREYSSTFYDPVLEVVIN